MFDDELHKIALSDDGSFTAYSSEYNEHYHSTQDGALSESLLKHVKPAFSCIKKNTINILDICYGLGFNTLATLFFIKEQELGVKLKIYSVELDETLIKSLEYFTYPKEFEAFKDIILQLSSDGVYEDENLYIEIFLGDAREYVRRFEDKFDMVYQDAFSPSVNPILWTKEYFTDIKNAMKQESILTTYSIALKTRLALHENGFNIYLNSGDGFRNATVASLSELNMFEKVNMRHKISCNPDVVPLHDKELRVDYS